MSQTIKITRSVTLPDPRRVALYQRAPELGPRILFFTGGTALRSLSQEIIRYSHNTMHMMTPFDSGGSSAAIRKSFGMLAVGDIRNRLMALADRSLQGNPAIFDLFAYRFPKDETREELLERLNRLLTAKDERIRRVPDPMRKIIRAHLRFFAERMPDDFDLRGASIGNLILTGGYFNHKRHIDPVIYLFSKLVEARGTVRPIINRDLHLVSELESGEVRVGQHLITGKETSPITSPIKQVWIAEDEEDPQPVEIEIRDKVKKLITTSDMICYPMGSFYSSLIANILPKGVGDAIAEASCPKIYVPNTGNDPEMKGMSLFDAVRTLFNYLEQSCTERTPRDSLLNFILIDSKNGNYNGPIEINKIKRFGVEVIDAPLVTEASAPYLDENAVIEYLLSLT